MIAVSASPASTVPATVSAAVTGSLAERYVGDLVVASGRPQPLYAGSELGPAGGFPDETSALAATARATDGAASAAVLVRDPAGTVHAHALEGPVWKHSWFRDEVVASSPLDMYPSGRSDHRSAEIHLRNRASSTDLSGTITAGTYGATAGTVVGVVDDGWARLGDRTIDLGTPVHVAPPSPRTWPAVTSKVQVGLAADRAENILGTAFQAFDHLARDNRRDARASAFQPAWTSLRDAAASIQALVAGSVELPDGLRERLQGGLNELGAADDAMAKVTRITAGDEPWITTARASVHIATDAVHALQSSDWLRPPGPKNPDPKPPTTKPTKPPTPGDGALMTRDVRVALELLTKSADALASIPRQAQEAQEWLPTRKAARQDNLDAQTLIEDRFLDPSTSSSAKTVLHTADGDLEDATWQIVGKPSPDGRFNGVDIPGALRDTRDAIRLLTGLVTS